MKSKLLRFGLAVLAGFCVQARFGQAKALDWLSGNDVRIDDLVNISFGHVAVPDGVGIHHDVWPMLALI